MKTTKKETWYTEFGVLRAYNGNDAQMDEFLDIVEALQKAIKPLEGRVTYRDLYEIAKDAAATAVGNLVSAHVNARDNKKLFAKKGKQKRTP